MATHSSTLAGKIPRTEEPGRLQSMGSRRVGHDWATSLSLFTFMHCRRKWQPTPVFLPGESQGRGAWWAAIYGVAQSQIRLKWLSSSSGNLKKISITAKHCISLSLYLSIHRLSSLPLTYLPVDHLFNIYHLYLSIWWCCLFTKLCPTLL